MINPVILLMTLSCLREPCFEKNDCHVRYGEMLTPKLANCIVQQCTESLQPCILQTIQDVAREMQRKNPSASYEYLVLQAGEAVLMDFELILNCLNEIDESPFDAIVCFVEAFLGDTQEDKTDQKPLFMFNIQDFYSEAVLMDFELILNCLNEIDESPFDAIVCFVEAFLGDTQEDKTDQKPLFMFNIQDFYKEAMQKFMESMHCLKKPNEDPIEAIMCVLEAFLGDNNQDFSSYMLCWIKTSLNRIVRNCYSHYDKNTLNTLVKHLTNNQEHQTCYLKRFSYLGHKCILVSMQIFGKFPPGKTLPMDD
ncbi:uncharacterized protein LOC128530049 [Clarias gariepinus]|uniref:uncharacterized protein LOC128530049 n=1 Tax=Clarias gariepinus TaxID=13013 RepID=UPI00234D2201|nr:uncharacterized protein LOC128530049 [Clarias gariepinus]